MNSSLNLKRMPSCICVLLAFLIEGGKHIQMSYSGECCFSVHAFLFSFVTASVSSQVGFLSSFRLLVVAWRPLTRGENSHEVAWKDSWITECYRKPLGGNWLLTCQHWTPLAQSISLRQHPPTGLFRPVSVKPWHASALLGPSSGACRQATLQPSVPSFDMIWILIPNSRECCAVMLLVALLL